jgi:F-type H+-transporting ATPase subunit gamma
MSNLRAIKDKIINIKSIKKIFSVMQLIAASKMHKAQEDVNSSNRVIDNIKDLFIRAVDGDLSVINQLSPVNNDAPMLYIAFCSDRGLCGNYNTIVSRKVQENLNANSNSRLIIIGNKLMTILARKFGQFIDSKNSQKFDDVRKDETKIVELLKKVFAMYKRGEISGCEVIYVFSKNAISKKVLQIDLFKIEELSGLLSKNLSVKSNGGLSESDGSESEEEKPEDAKYIYEGSTAEVVNYLLEYFLRARFFNIFRNAYFSELASRMVAMDSASRNSSEIEKALTIDYNKKRQAAITSELVDIISGAENA